MFKSIQINSYMAHPEAIIIAMLGMNVIPYNYTDDSLNNRNYHTKYLGKRCSLIAGTSHNPHDPGTRF